MFLDLIERSAAKPKCSPHTWPLRLLQILICLCAGLIAGCGGFIGPSLKGVVHAGQQPVTGARVYLFTAGASGLGSASRSLLNASMMGVSTDGTGAGYVTTDHSGSFEIAADWSCAKSTDQVYILAIGGNPGPANGTGNAALAMMAGLGTCSTLLSTYPSLVINEVTTVASVWTLRPFMADAFHLGSSATNAVGLLNAFAQIPNLVNIATGQALTRTSARNGAVPQSKINTLADILAPCVNSASGASAACGGLFSAASASGKAQPSDTIAAALLIAQNPALKVSALFGLSAATPPFEPRLARAPNDWLLSVNLTGGGLNGPTSPAVDALGNLWVSNYFGGASEFSSQGAPLSAAGYSGGGLNESFGLAIDSGNRVWIANEQSNSGVNHGLGAVTVLDSKGQPLSGSSGYSAGGIYFPIGVTADPNGNMWVVDYGDSRVTLLSSSGTSLSGATGWGRSSLDFPVAIAVDSRHNAWVANQSANTITRISADGATNTVITCCDGASGIATDQSNNVWVTNYYGDSISEVSNTGAVLLNGITGGGIMHPQGIAVDGNGTVWVANYRGNSISALSGASSPSPGTFLSPVSGFGTDASLLEPYGLAIDASGNVWVSNSGNDTITQFLGVATPIKTPLAGPPSHP